MEKKRNRRARLDTLLNADESPLFMLNSKRRVVFLNSAFEQLTQWTMSNLSGMACEYSSEAATGSAESFCQGLCPPPQVLAGQPSQIATYLLARDGTSHPRMIHFFPLFNEPEKLHSILGVVTPIESPAKAKLATPAQQLHADLAALRSLLHQRFDQSQFIGKCPPMLRVLEQMQVAQSVLSPLTIVGELGTGKEHLARVIHQASGVKQNSFVPINCQLLPPLEIQTTLRRIFRSEQESRDNESTQAGHLQPGTIYLSHVDHLTRDLQEIVLEEFGKIDSNTSHILRLIVSSTKPLANTTDDDQSLLSDFFYFVTPMTITLPPLRERMNDLPLIAQLFLEQRNSGSEKQLGGFDEKMWKEFREYNWPGNIRELHNVVTEAAEACEEGDVLVQPDHLPFRFRTGRDAQTIGPTKTYSPEPLAQQLDQFETAKIREALAQAKQNKTLAAEMLGMTRPKLYRRMQALGLESSDSDGSE